MMKSETHGTITSAEVEITNISSHGIWILSKNNEEMFLSYNDFPWFKDIPIGKILNIQEPFPGHF